MYRSCLPSISTVYSDNNHHHNHGILHASTQIKKQTLIKCSSDAKNARRTKELQVRQSERKKENEVWVEKNVKISWHTENFQGKLFYPLSHCFRFMTINREEARNKKNRTSDNHGIRIFKGEKVITFRNVPLKPLAIFTCSSFFSFSTFALDKRLFSFAYNFFFLLILKYSIFHLAIPFLFSLLSLSLGYFF